MLAAPDLLSWFNGHRPVCISGRHEFWKVTRVAENILIEDGFADGPVTYNNLPSTTGEDVISLLKQAGHRLEEHGE